MEHYRIAYEKGVQSRTWFRYFLGLLSRWKSNLTYAKARRIARKRGAKIGEHSIISLSLARKANSNLEIGDNVWIGHDALIFGAAGSKIVIERNAKVASRAILVTGYHEYGIQFDNIAGPGKWGDILIKAGATVGTNAMVVANKTVGEKAHVAAGSVVTHDVPPMVRVAGISARIIKYFNK